MRSLHIRVVALLALLLLAAPTAQAGVQQDPFAGDALAAAADVPEEFVEETAFDNLLAPASVAFAPDGRVFVGQLDGVIKVYDGVDDTTPSVYADISENVAWHGDRGLMAMTLDPAFTSGRPYVYVSYTYDAAIGQAAPRWNDNCPDPPGAERDGCVVSGRVSKLLPDGSEQPLIKDEWCQQYPGHSLGDLQFGADGALYITAGDGASYTFADYGQDGSPTNPCGDPGAPVGGSMTSPTAEGGALRSQDARTTADPTGLDGAMLRVDPDTGEPLPDNPGTGDKNARRIIAYGFRNPFRFAFRPGTTDAYVGDVGWLTWEELDRVPDTTSQVRNYGWPCYEGNGRQSGYEAVGLNVCRNLYTAGTAAAPLYTYNQAGPVATEDCPAGSSSISGVTFYRGETFPAAYRGAMFFADYTRNCIWVMFPDANGVPNPATRQVFVEGARTPVDLEMGPGGDLYYADVGGGTIRRIRAINPNQAPTAAFTATPSSGAAPLPVAFDATGSTDPNGDALQYAWDLDGDGAYDDSTSATPTRTYTSEGMVTVRLRVTDPSGSADTETTELTVGIPPTVTIGAPGGATTYRVGDRVDFSGSAKRADGSDVPPSRLLWTVDLHHCSAILATNCHVHRMTNYVGVASGWLSYPDHEFPSYVTLTLTATEASGLRGTTSVRLDPKTVQLAFNSTPSGLTVGVGGEAAATPFTRTVAQGSTVGVAAPPSQTKEGFSYDFGSWSDGGAATHQFTAPATASTYTVSYVETPCPIRDGLVGAWSFDETTGSVVYDSSGRGNPGTISGPARTTSGRFGGALSFDGSDDLVTINDSNSLDVVAGMTVEAWVNPDLLGQAWRTVAMKEQSGGLVYALYAHDGDGHATAHVATPFESRTTASALPLNTWTHLATTYDGGTLRLLVNGNQVSAMPAAGAVTVSNGALHVGGNAVWSEWFSGLIDELRVYDRALSAAEVRVDMTRPITCVSDPGAPILSVAPGSLSFSAQQGGAAPAAKALTVQNSGAGTLSWAAASDVPWLSVSPASGTGAGTVTATPAIGSLAAGTYTATVTVTAAGATGSPRAIPVTFTVDPPPQPPVLSISSSTLEFSAIAGAQTVETKAISVSNTGGGTLTFTASANVPWLTVSPQSGSAPRAVSVTPSAASLAPGVHAGTVTIAAAGVSGSPKTLTVTFTVTAAPACTRPAGLVGAWSFDEATGTTVGDASAAGNAGTVSGATRTAFGRFGGALSFDGVDDMVTIPDANSLDLTTGLTLSAWLNPAASTGSWRTVALKERPGAISYALYGNTDTAQAGGYIAAPLESGTKSTSALPAGVWTHLATTFDGSTLRLLVNGVQVSSRAVSGAAAIGTGALRIGGNAIWAEWFSGLLDEVRVYNRALGAAELQTDMTTAIACSAPPAQPVLAVSPPTLAFSGTAGGADPAAKTLAVANEGGGSLNWTATDDASWLSVRSGSGSGAGTITVTPALAGLAAGTYTATVAVTAASGSPKTVAVTLTVSPSTPPGLVAAYGFEETTGTGAADGSGQGNLGTVSGATSAANGRYGRALSFDGIDDWVTVPDATSLDLTTGMTMSAWMNPVQVGSAYRAVIFKEQPSGLIYTLYAGDGTGKPSSHAFTTSEFRATGPANTAPDAWTHLASTWDGVTLRLFVNGVEVSSRALTGTLRTSTGVLRIGGTAVWAEWFRGLIDEVRVYDRALTLPEIQGDMTRPVPAGS